MSYYASKLQVSDPFLNFLTDADYLVDGGRPGGKGFFVMDGR